MDNRFSTLLNFSRWAAAFLVVVSHLRNIVCVDFQQVEQKTLLIKAFYFFTGLGHQAVIVFFVISGLLVGGISLRRWKQRALSYHSYFIHRFSRIFVVLLPALLIGGLFDFAGMQFFNSSGLYTHATTFPIATLNFSAQEHLTIASFAGSMLMLQPFVTPSFGSNGPLWSLSYEWWYYCVFATALVFLGTKTPGKKALYFVVLIAFTVALPLELILWMSIWMLGVTVFMYSKSRLPRVPPSLAIVVFSGAILFSSFAEKFGLQDLGQNIAVSFAKDLFIGVGFTLILIAFHGRFDRPRTEFHQPRWLTNVNNHLADFSYTTYLCHFPFMLLWLALSTDIFHIPLKQQPTIPTLMFFLVTVACIYVYTHIFSQMTERHTAVVRMRLEAWFSRSRNAIAR